MKTTAFVSLLLLAACSPPPEEGKVSDSGRPETRSIEAADVLGYQGKPVRQKVDAALDTNDQRVDQLNQSIDAQSQ
jgi:hypothetical protein